MTLPTQRVLRAMVDDPTREVYGLEIARLAEAGQAPQQLVPAEVEVKVFKKYGKKEEVFDGKSVMLYAFPPSWMLGGHSCPLNHETVGDRQPFVRAIYPGRRPIGGRSVASRWRRTTPNVAARRTAVGRACLLRSARGRGRPARPTARRGTGHGAP